LKLKDGAVVRGIYQHALSFIKDKKPSLEKNFVKSIGFGVSRYDCYGHCVSADTIPQMGLEFRDSAYLLSPKNTRHLKENMVMNLALGFSDLQDDNGKTCVCFHGT
jgi:nucleosome binding factor SPN SPT16 subunit